MKELVDRKDDNFLWRWAAMRWPHSGPLQQPFSRSPGKAEFLMYIIPHSRTRTWPDGAPVLLPGRNTEIVLGVAGLSDCGIKVDQPSLARRRVLSGTCPNFIDIKEQK